MVVTSVPEASANPTAETKLSNDNIAYYKNLFAGIIDDKYLSCDDLFIQTSRPLINEQIEGVGRKLQEEKVKTHYKKFYQLLGFC